MALKITLTYGGTEYRIKAYGELNLTKTLVRDDSGAWFYRNELSKFRVYKEGYELLKNVDDSISSCEEIELNVWQNCEVGEGMNLKYTGVLTARGCNYNYNKCYAEIESKVRDNYTCLYENWEKDINILEAANSRTCKEPDALYPFFGYQFSIEFHLGDNTGLTNPTGIGWDTANSTLFTGTEGTYKIWWRFFTVVDCLGGSPPPTPQPFMGVEDNCSLNGTAKWVLITDTDGTLPPPSLVSIDSFSFSDYPDYDTVPTLPILIDLGSFYPGEVVIYVPNLNSIQDYSNGRRIDDVLELFTSSCTGVEQVKSDFFRINSTATSTIVSESNLNIDLYKNLLLYQITDILFADADVDATRAYTTFKQTLRDFNKLFRVFWRIHEVDGLTTFQIEHESYWNEIQGQDKRSEAKGYRKVDSLRETFPRFETFSTVAQRNLDFVGMDIEYPGQCVGDEKKVNTVQTFVTDYPFLLAVEEDDYPNLDSFVLLQTSEFSGDLWIGGFEGALTGVTASNMAVSWSWLHKYFHKHERPTPTITLNGTTTQAESVSPSKSMSFRTALTCSNAIDPSERIQVMNEKFIRVTKIEEDLKQCRATIEGEY